jgi:hypothetical protein
MNTVDRTSYLEREENASLSPFSANFFPGYRPPEGYSNTFWEAFDGRLDNGLLDLHLAPSATNLGVAMALPPEPIVAQYGPSVVLDPEGPSLAFEGDPPRSLVRIASFHLEANKHYLLTYDTRLDDAGGVVLVSGAAGDRQTNIVKGIQHHYTALWTTTGRAVDADIDSLAFCLGATRSCSGRFSAFKMRSYEPDDLPIVVSSLSPYRAQVREAKGGYLETNRMSVPGYAVRVNGTPVQPAVSPRGRVMVPLAQIGNSTVEIDYVGTPGMVVSRRVSAIAWVAAAGALIVWQTARFIRLASWRTPERPDRRRPGFPLVRTYVSESPPREAP